MTSFTTGFADLSRFSSPAAPGFGAQSSFAGPSLSAPFARMAGQRVGQPTTFGPTSDAFRGLPSGGQRGEPSRSELEDAARRLFGPNVMIRGDRVITGVQAGTGAELSRSINDLSIRRAATAGRTTLLDQLTGALGGEIEQQRGAAGRQFGRNEAEIEATREALMRGLTELRGAGGAESERLLELAGEQREVFEAGVTEAIEGFRDLSNQQIAQISSDINRDVGDARRAISAGFNPQTGEPLRPGEGEALFSSIEREAGLRQGRAVVELRSRFNEQLLQARLAASQQRLGSLEGQRALFLASAQLRTSIAAAATQLELQGRTALAELVRANPESIISTFSGLVALAELATAPGGGSIPGLNLNPFQGAA